MATQAALLNLIFRNGGTAQLYGSHMVASSLPSLSWPECPTPASVSAPHSHSWDHSSSLLTSGSPGGVSDSGRKIIQVTLQVKNGDYMRNNPIKNLLHAQVPGLAAPVLPFWPFFCLLLSVLQLGSSISCNKITLNICTYVLLATTDLFNKIQANWQSGVHH